MLTRKPSRKWARSPRRGRGDALTRTSHRAGPFGGRVPAVERREQGLAKAGNGRVRRGMYPGLCAALCRLDPPPRNLPPMRMTASWSSPQQELTAYKVVGRRSPHRPQVPLRSTGVSPATVNRHRRCDPDQLSVTPCSPPSRTLGAASGGAPEGASLTASARAVTGPRHEQRFLNNWLDNWPHTRVGKAKPAHPTSDSSP